MRLALISDTHAKTIPDHQMPDCDVLVHAGDVTNNGKINQLRLMMEWFQHLANKYRHIVFIGGNHDFILEDFMKENVEYAIHERLCALPNIHYLRDSGVTIDGKYFYGTPWVICGDWAFSEMDHAKRREKFARIPMYTNVLITHGPSYSILDRCVNGAHGVGSVGDMELLGAVERVRPQVHVFGHIHDGYGIYENCSTKFVNAAVTIVKGGYELGNPPIVVEI